MPVETTSHPAGIHGIRTLAYFAGVAITHPRESFGAQLSPFIPQRAPARRGIAPTAGENR